MVSLLGNLAGLLLQVLAGSIGPQILSDPALISQLGTMYKRQAGRIILAVFQGRHPVQKSKHALSVDDIHLHSAQKDKNISEYFDVFL